MEVRALYLGDTSDGVKVHSFFLSKCDAQATFEKFKARSVNKDKAPIFIDLYDDEKSLILETIGIDEETYSQITGEMVMSYEYYQRESDFNQDLVFGAIEQVIREQGIDVPWSEKDSLGLSARKLQKFRQSDHILREISVDELVIK
ncbi:hypothetical protein G3489_19475 [Shewanella baltica]|uniref:hypothetical protein n=1 Tax=Shewanella baltica TaxID=62322 RepID=UPI00217F07A3|nr:hypothetical protein [Shewanella baltica]MCS6271858.1 hypothetical protein [Shewanella baltica]